MLDSLLFNWLVLIFCDVIFLFFYDINSIKKLKTAFALHDLLESASDLQIITVYSASRLRCFNSEKIKNSYFLSLVKKKMNYR